MRWRTQPRTTRSAPPAPRARDVAWSHSRPDNGPTARGLEISELGVKLIFEEGDMSEKERADGKAKFKQIVRNKSRSVKVRFEASDDSQIVRFTAKNGTTSRTMDNT